MGRFVEFKQSVIDSILSYAKMAHPNEGILLLRGRTSKDRIAIEEVAIPPSATHGQGFASFPLSALPIDFSIVGVAHSHPTGVLEPSINDLNQFYGRVMVIVAYPYESESDVAVFDGEGRPVRYKIT